MSTAAPSGDLSFATVGAALAAHGGATVLDLAAVSRVDSAGLSLLLELTRRAKARGAGLEIRNASEQVRGLASFFGVDSLLNFQ